MMYIKGIQEAYENAFNGRIVKETNLIETELGHDLILRLSKDGRPDLEIHIKDYKFNTLLEE